MLHQLNSLLSEGAIINLTVSKLKDDRLCVIVIIKDTERKKQTGPLTIKGTADQITEALTEKLLTSHPAIVTALELNSKAFDESLEEDEPKSSFKKPATKVETKAVKKNLTEQEKLDAELDTIHEAVQATDVRTEVYEQWKKLSVLSKKHKTNTRITTMMKEVNKKLLEISDREDEMLFKDQPKEKVKEPEIVDDGMGDDPDDPDEKFDEIKEEVEEENFEMEESDDPDSVSNASEEEEQAEDSDEGDELWK